MGLFRRIIQQIKAWFYILQNFENNTKVKCTQESYVLSICRLSLTEVYIRNYRIETCFAEVVPHYAVLFIYRQYTDMFISTYRVSYADNEILTSTLMKDVHKLKDLLSASSRYTIVHRWTHLTAIYFLCLQWGIATIMPSIHNQLWLTSSWLMNIKTTIVTIRFWSQNKTLTKKSFLIDKI